MAVGVRWCVVSWEGVICIGSRCRWCWGKGPDDELAGLNASHVWCWGIVRQTSCVGSSVTLLLDTPCSTGTFVYFTGDLFRFGLLPVAIMTVVMGSARNNDTVSCCMWEPLFN
jgi:hypothetical protein